MGLIDPPGEIQEGSRIVFEGRDLVPLSDREMESIRGNEISMIFQEPMTSLNPVYPVGEQIAEAVRIHRGADRREAMERAREMLELVGIPEVGRRLKDYPHQLSGGMRQRVMIAIALACDPKLIIADEPTTALDVTIQAQILELMIELRERLGMSILLITHDLGVVAEMCDEVVVMYAGRVVERGPVAEVFTSPQHPYTEALLQSIPMLGMTQAEPLRVIRGTVPSPLDWPEGCRFSPRCDYAFERCERAAAALPRRGPAVGVLAVRARPPRAGAGRGGARMTPDASSSTPAASRSTSRFTAASCAARSGTSRPSTASTSRSGAARRSGSSASRAAGSRRSGGR